MIQLSPTTDHFLTKLIGGYVTQSRGEIIVKVSVLTKN